MKVTIVIPVYNCEKFLEENIDSMLNQTYKNIEIIYVDDGSTDSSLEILEKYRDRITILKQKNQGAPAARNNGLKKATGDYIMFFDSDDILDKDAISVMMKNNDNSDLIQGNYKIVDEKGKYLREKNAISHIEEVTNNILKRCILLPPFPCNKLYKRKTIIDNNIVFDNVKIAQDLNFYIKFLAISNKITLITDSVMKYRISTNSISRTYTFKILDIKNTFKQTEEFLKKINKDEYIDEYLCVAKLEHYEKQINKIYFFKEKKDRKTVIDFFYNEIRNIDFSHSKIEYKKKLRRVKIKHMLKNILTSNIYSKHKIR